MDLIKNFLFPKKCVECGKMGKYICDECSVGMWEEEQICPGCRRASRYGLRHVNCKSPLDGLTCFWAYEGIARKLIQKIKYGGYYDYLSEFSITNLQFSSNSQFSQFEKFLKQSPIVVPIPLHKNRLRKRGFNQAELIARLVFNYQLPIINKLLVRVKDTGQQVGKSREVRLQNMDNVFSINSNFQIPKYVLLVDDVWTTGATMTSAAKTLKKAGVEKVWGFVLAR